MPKKRKYTDKVTTNWAIKPRTYQKIAIYQKQLNLDSLEITANILLEKATSHIQIPEQK